jgi:hypothetical protein
MKRRELITLLVAGTGPSVFAIIGAIIRVVPHN